MLELVWVLFVLQLVLSVVVVVVVVVVLVLLLLLLLVVVVVVKVKVGGLPGAWPGRCPAPGTCPRTPGDKSYGKPVWGINKHIMCITDDCIQ